MDATAVTTHDKKVRVGCHRLAVAFWALNFAVNAILASSCFSSPAAPPSPLSPFFSMRSSSLQGDEVGTTINGSGQGVWWMDG